MTGSMAVGVSYSGACACVPLYERAWQGDVHDAVQHVAVLTLREHEPRSRAVAPTTWAGSTGCRRIARCVYTGRVVATSAAAWPETQASVRAREAHGTPASIAYLRVVAPERLAAVLALHGTEGL